MKTHVMGDAVVQTCLKAGKFFTKWARRMPNVPFAAPASWTWQSGTAELKGRNTKAELVRKQQEELDELSSRGIPYEVTQTVLERTRKVVQEQVGVGSALQGLKTKVWRSRNATQQCSSCGIYVSDKDEHGAYRCRGARNTTAKFTGQCCNCRFSVDMTNKAENQISVKHSCQACKAWRHVHAQHSKQITQSKREVERTTLETLF